MTIHTLTQDPESSLYLLDGKVVRLSLLFGSFRIEGYAGIHMQFILDDVRYVIGVNTNDGTIVELGKVLEVNPNGTVNRSESLTSLELPEYHPLWSHLLP